MSSQSRLVPLIVASPLFLQNLDSSVMATALPSIAESMQVPTLHLNLAITSYLLSLAVFLPVSGWLSDRLGAKRVFCLAIACFSVGSAFCGLANSLPTLVLSRVLQGLGGAMMVPVGRLILLRSVPHAQMVSAMVWFTIPPVVGRMIGPLFGGAVVTYTSWRWIFLINIPFGLLAIWLASVFVQEAQEKPNARDFDTLGFLYMSCGLCLLLTAIEITGKSIAPLWVSGLMAGAGMAALWLYMRHSRLLEFPIIDFKVLQFQTFKNNVVGGIPLRMALGASPFLLPLMLQLGFGLAPMESGLLTVATAVGALCTRAVLKYSLRKFGFRTLIMGATMVTSALFLAYGLMEQSTHHVLIFCTLMAGGLFNSMCLVTLSTLGFSEIPQHQMSHATTLTTMAQQLTVSMGVVLGSSMLTVVSWWHGGDGVKLQAQDFPPAFVAIGLLSLLSLLSFRKLQARDGDQF